MQDALFPFEFKQFSQKRRYLDLIKDPNNVGDQWEGMVHLIDNVNKNLDKYERDEKVAQKIKYKNELELKMRENVTRKLAQKEKLKKLGQEIKKEYEAYKQVQQGNQQDQIYLNQRYVYDNLSVADSKRKDELERKYQFQQQYESRLEQHYQQMESDRQLKLEQQRYLRQQKIDDLMGFKQRQIAEKEKQKKVEQEKLRHIEAYSQKQINNEKNYRYYYRKTMLDEQKRQLRHQEALQKNQESVAWMGRQREIPLNQNYALNYKLDDINLKNQKKRRQSLQTSPYYGNKKYNNRAKSFQYCGLSELDLQERQLSKDIYKRTLDAQKKQKNYMKNIKVKMSQVEKMQNRSNLNNLKAGIPVIQGLIPGINSGLVMNPRYKRGKGNLPPFLGQNIENDSLDAISKSMDLQALKDREQREKLKPEYYSKISINKKGKFNYRLYTNPLQRFENFKFFNKPPIRAQQDDYSLKSIEHHNPIFNPIPNNQQNPYIRSQMKRQPLSSHGGGPSKLAKIGSQIV